MIPVILLTGFLGAGKTTLLNHLIDYYKSKKTVLLINEFGTVGIDEKLLKNGNYQKIELNRGSLFCICIRTDFISELKRITNDIKPDLLIIEATGLADTTEMEKMMSLPGICESIILKACICIVDVQTFIKVKKFAKAPVSQVKSADIILLNKIDLASKENLEEVEKSITEINSKAVLIKTVFSEFSFQEIDSVKRIKPSVTLPPGDGFPDPFKSITLEGEGNFTDNSFQELVKELKPDMLRLKGFVNIDGMTYFVDGNTNSVSLSKAQSGVWKKNSNILVFIGKANNNDKLKETFRKAINS